MRPVRARLFALAVAAVAATAFGIPATATAFQVGGAQAGGRLIAPGRTAPAAVSDQNGGVIVASRDLNTGIAVVNRYAAGGAALWDQGLAFPNASGVQLLSDGAGGAIVAVQHPESPTMTVGRILQSGATTWQASFPVGALVSGGDGGAWVISQAGELFADGITAAGDLRPRLQISASPDSEALPTALGDGNGGAWLAWRAAQQETQFALRLQHIAADGSVWDAPADVAGSSEPNLTPSLSLDGRGGVLVSWTAAERLWIHDYGADGLPAWNSVVTLDVPAGGVASVQGEGGAAFVAWTRRLRSGPLPTDLLHVSYIGSSGALWWTRNVASVPGGVLDLKMSVASGAAAVGWQASHWPVVGGALDPDLFVYRVTAGGAETYPPSARDLASSLGPDAFGSIVDAGGGSVVAVFTQSPCFRGDVTGVAMQRISPAGARSFGADGACP